MRSFGRACKIVRLREKSVEPQREVLAYFGFLGVDFFFRRCRISAVRLIDRFMKFPTVWIRRATVAVAEKLLIATMCLVTVRIPRRREIM